jgi:hypothetical protein
VVFLSVFAFMVWQNHLPQQLEDIDKQVLLIPVLGYGLLSMILVFWAFRVDMASLAWIGLVDMSPTLAVNLALFLRWKTRTGQLEVVTD